MTEPVSDDRLDRATDPEYAAVCPLAVIALVVGVLGGAAFLAAPLVAVPAVAIGLALAARRKIRKSQGVLVGRKLAVAGLVLGIATAAAGGGYHLLLWQGKQQTLEDLETQAIETLDEILAGRYETVFEKLPDDSLQRKLGLDAFRQGISGLLDGAGGLVGRDLMSLQILPFESGGLVAPADMRVNLERRILEVTLWFRQEEDGHWRLAGVGGQETVESIAKYGDEGVPPGVPAPYQRGHGHDHHH
ncbi:MAG: hypothetical protein AMK72_06310 [Planctomycetes bacterium SM23_25]|nr:MAG: hypothetical protein AMS14_02870 [Planctomycetes bacterium DG_20]KPK48678.1 MAG: hypothetical protein AMK72_06310 [Planctomycetes bacterium SM23_25]